MHFPNVFQTFEINYSHRKQIIKWKLIEMWDRKTKIEPWAEESRAESWERWNKVSLTVVHLQYEEIDQILTNYCQTVGDRLYFLHIIQLKLDQSKFTNLFEKLFWNYCVFCTYYAYYALFNLLENDPQSCTRVSINNQNAFPLFNRSLYGECYWSQIEERLSSSIQCGRNSLFNHIWDAFVRDHCPRSRYWIYN